MYRYILFYLLVSWFVRSVASLSVCLFVFFLSRITQKKLLNYSNNYHTIRNDKVSHGHYLGANPDHVTLGLEFRICGEVVQCPPNDTQ